jgi:hypothetical protein
LDQLWWGGVWKPNFGPLRPLFTSNAPAFDEIHPCQVLSRSCRQTSLTSFACLAVLSRHSQFGDGGSFREGGTGFDWSLITVQNRCDQVRLGATSRDQLGIFFILPLIYFNLV